MNKHTAVARSCVAVYTSRDAAHIPTITV